MGADPSLNTILTETTSRPRPLQLPLIWSVGLSALPPSHLTASCDIGRFRRREKAAVPLTAQARSPSSHNETQRSPGPSYLLSPRWKSGQLGPDIPPRAPRLQGLWQTSVPTGTYNVCAPWPCLPRPRLLRNIIPATAIQWFESLHPCSPTTSAHSYASCCGHAAGKWVPPSPARACRLVYWLGCRRAHAEPTLPLPRHDEHSRSTAGTSPTASPARVGGTPDTGGYVGLLALGGILVLSAYLSPIRGSRRCEQE